MPNNAGELADALARIADLAGTAAPAEVADAMAYVTASTMVGKLGGGPPPSAPGTPPARRSGHLQNSVTVVPATGGAGIAEAQAGNSAVYARIHEYGGDTGRGHATHLPPRPYIAPSVDDDVASGALTQAAVEAFTRAVGLAGG